MKKSMDWFLAGNNRFLFHIMYNNQVAGYCGGFVSEYVGDGSTSGMMRHALRQAFAGVLKKPWLLFNKNVTGFYPLIFRNVFKVLGAGKKKQNNSVHIKPHEEKKAGLVVIGVHPAHRGKEVFSLLMAEFENQARKRSIEKMVLTVKKDNLRAINAYQKQHWYISRERELSLQMMKVLNNVYQENT